MFATTNQKEPNTAPNVSANVPPYPDGKDFDTLDDMERCRAEENCLREARGKGAASPAPEVAILIRGDQRTFEFRERLKAAGMHWLPQTRAWSGTVPESFVPQMQAEGLQVVPLVPEGHPLDRFRESFVEKALEFPSPRAPVRKPKACARKEASVKVSPQERAADFLPEHGWTVEDITANLADDDRAADERRVERHLRDLRARVKAVRALISADPTIRETLATSREKAKAFYAIHGVTETQVKRGVPDVDVTGLEGEELVAALRGWFPGAPATGDWVAEEAERVNAILPGTEM